MKGAVSCLRPPPEIVPEAFNVFGVSTSDEILFSVHSADERSAEQVTSVAFDQTVLNVDGQWLRLEGLATIQDTAQAGVLVVRSKFVPLPGEVEFNAVKGRA